MHARFHLLNQPPDPMTSLLTSLLLPVLLFPLLLYAGTPNTDTPHASTAADPDLPPNMVNICVDNTGKKILSNQHCPPGYRTQTHTLKPNVLSTQGLRDWAKRSPYTSDYEARQQERNLQDSLRIAKQQERQQRCENARRDYSFESTWKSHRAKPGSKKAIMNQECKGL